MFDYYELDENTINGLNINGILDKLECDYYRVISSFINFSVYLNETFIGIVNLNTESTDDFVFLDIYILKEFQGLGYGKEITNYFMDKFKNKQELLIAQTKDDNIKANRVLNSLGNFIMKCKDSNYYLLGDLVKLTDDKTQKLTNHINYSNGLINNQIALNEEKDYTLIKNNYNKI